jgi:hypothetical protein
MEDSGPTRTRRARVEAPEWILGLGRVLGIGIGTWLES